MGNQGMGNQGMSNFGGSSGNNGGFNGFRNPYASYGLGNFAFNPAMMQGQGQGRGNVRGRGNRGQNRGQRNNFAPNFDYYGYGSGITYNQPSYGRNNGMQYGYGVPSYQGSSYMTSGNVPSFWYFG